MSNGAEALGMDDDLGSFISWSSETTSLFCDRVDPETRRHLRQLQGLSFMYGVRIQLPLTETCAGILGCYGSNRE